MIKNRRRYTIRNAGKMKKVIFYDSKDTPSCGGLFTLSWHSLRAAIQNAGYKNVRGFRVSDDGIDVVHDEVLSVGESLRRFDKLIG